MEGDLTLGGKHTMQCTDDMLWKCEPGNCMYKFNKKRKSKKK